MSSSESPDEQAQTPEARLQTLERKGLQALDAGDFNEAARLLLQVVTGYEKTGNALLTNSAGYYLGVAFAGQGREERAARVWEEIIDRGWDSPAAFNQLVRYYEARDSPDDVERLFTRLHRAAHERTGEFFALPAVNEQGSRADRPMDHAAPGSTHRVLVVDDEPEICAIVERVLGAAGFDVKRAMTGMDGLRLVLNTRLDAIVLDHYLPGYTGLDILYRMRGAGIETPVLMISGRHEPQIVEDAGRLGARWLAKPFDPDAVVEIVQKSVRAD
ncbi:MAG TPA: response regulator [Acidobacteriota bacterium]